MSAPDLIAERPPLLARLFRLGSVGFVGLVVGMLLACNVIHLQRQSLRRDFSRAGMHDATVQLGPERVHYWRGGTTDTTRPPLLLLHGFGGAAVWQWAEQVKDLAPDRVIVVPDLLWFGGSSSEVDDPTLEHQVAAVVALLDHEQLPRVDVVGISYGGLVGALLTRMHADRVHRLVLVDSPGSSYTAQDHAALLARFEVEQIDEVIVPDDEAGVRRLLEIAYHDPPRTPAFALRQVRREMYDPHRQRQLALLDALEEHRARYVSDEPLAVPLGLVWGDGDQVFPLEIAQRLATLHDAPLHVLPQARHAPNLEHPQRFNEALRILLDDELPQPVGAR